MQQAIRDLEVLGSLPDEDVDAERIKVFEEKIKQVTRPITDEEAKVLVQLFGSDEAYGLAWTLLHIIETAPGWPIQECLQMGGNEWIERLLRRAQKRIIR